ncbi:hypothetical protein P9A06_04700 [Serratia marcescens]|uniref:hypothetical protein n=1 Tax=Serratia marcescens TaxID=615 RepID=UPI003204F213
MGKMTFIVDFPDGQEPAIGFATSILGGQLLSFAFSDLRHEWAWRSAADSTPPEGEYVVVSDGECCSVGRFIYGEWLASGGRCFLEPVKHWMPLPAPVEVQDES